MGDVRKLIIITGLPASGKTTLANKLADDLGLPLFTKDEIKESLFDTLGIQDRKWSAKLGAASMDLIWIIGRNHLRASRSVILEANFKTGQHEPRFKKLNEDCAYDLLQIVCTLPDSIVRKRFSERAKSSSRHVGHRDDTPETMAGFEQTLQAKHGRALNVISKVFKVNTLSEKSVNYESVLHKTKQFLSESDV